MQKNPTPHSPCCRSESLLEPSCGSDYNSLKVPTQAEKQPAKTPEGVDMVKQLRQNLIAQGRDRLCDQLAELTGAKTLALFTDIDAHLGERVFVITLDRDLEATFR